MPSVVWLQVGKVDGDVEVHIIDEVIHDTNIKTEELAEIILSKDYAVQQVYCDPAGAGVQSTSGIGDVEIFKKKGIFPSIPCIPACKNILAKLFATSANACPNVLVPLIKPSMALCIP